MSEQIIKSKGDVGKEHSGGVAAESPRPAQETTEQWIEKRYGPIIIEARVVWFGVLRVPIVVASVPVYRGSAIGLGATDEAAIEALQRDLFCHPPVVQRTGVRNGKLARLS